MSQKINVEKIVVDGKTYVAEDSVTPRLPGKRAVIVVDRGWVVAGDVHEENGRIHLSRALWIFKWESVGFDGVIANPKHQKVTLLPFPNGFNIPAGSEIFRVPVSDDWGL